MLLICPACNSRFLVPATAFAAGPRQVRCARCAHTWQAELPKEPASELVSQLLELTPPPILSASNSAAPPKTPRGKWRRWVDIGAIVLACMLLSWFLLDRQDIARRWPLLDGFYENIGLHIYHPGEGLSLQQVHSELNTEGGAPHLVVEGKIHNETPKIQQIPNLMAVAMGSDGKPMQSWQINAPAATLAPAETISFQSSIRSPKGTVVEVNLSFIEPPHAP